MGLANKVCPTGLWRKENILKQDSSQHGLRITENMVEQVAVVAYEDVRKRNQDERMPSWSGAPAIIQHEMKANALGILKLTLPILLEEGWTPPVAGDAS